MLGSVVRIDKICNWRLSISVHVKLCGGHSHVSVTLYHYVTKCTNSNGGSIDRYRVVYRFKKKRLYDTVSWIMLISLVETCSRSGISFSFENNSGLPKNSMIPVQGIFLARKLNYIIACEVRLWVCATLVWFWMATVVDRPENTKQKPSSLYLCLA